MACQYKDSTIGYACVNITGAGCGSTTSDGYCQGSVVYWCGSDGTLHHYDCSDESLGCGDTGGGYYDCTTAGGGGAGCGSVTAEGYCDGETAVYCDGGSVQHENCGVYSNAHCGYDSANSWYGCVDDVGGGSGGG